MIFDFEYEIVIFEIDIEFEFFYQSNGKVLVFNLNYLIATIFQFKLRK